MVENQPPATCCAIVRAMRMHSFAAVLAAGLAVAACGKSADKPAGGSGSGSGKPGSASGSDVATPVEGPRPSTQPQPPLPPLELPEDPKRAQKVALGHALFFDNRL